MFHIFGFYKFKRLSGLKKLKKTFQEKLIKNYLRGTIIFSKEGINGTISGKKNNIEKVKKSLKNICKIKYFDSENNSTNNFQPFHRGKTKIKKEVVPIGVQVSPSQKFNNSIEPKKWNSLLKEKDIKIIDARKPFEYDVGTFEGAENPNINNFRDFPKYLKKFNKKNKIAMFCTGGIRCEKASFYLKNKGFKNIFQLKGGILNYLKKINEKQSLWRGECYVFDNRVSVKHKLVLRIVQVPCTVRFPQTSTLPVLRKSCAFILKDDNERNRVCESFCLHIRKLLRVFASDPDVKLKSSSE